MNLVILTKEALGDKGRYFSPMHAILKGEGLLDVD